MTCRGARRRLSAHLDGELSREEAAALAAHLEACPECARRWLSLRRSMALLADAPRLAPSESISGRLLARLEVESRGPGLAQLFRPSWAARPLILPSLVPAALVLVAVLAGILALDSDPRSLTAHAAAWPRALPPSGTEGNPLFPSTGVAAPRSHDVVPADVLAGMEEGTLFVETVVARDGSVSTVTLLQGDSEQARPVLDALRHERFEPGRYRGRPVAVSVYRLISRMDVRAPTT